MTSRTSISNAITAMESGRAAQREADDPHKKSYADADADAFDGAAEFPGRLT